MITHRIVTLVLGLASTLSVSAVSEAMAQAYEPPAAAPAAIKQYRAEFLPDGSGILALQSGDRPSGGYLVRMSVDGTGIVPIDVPVERVSSFDLARDGRRVAFTGHDADGVANIYVLDLASGQTRQLTQGRGNGEPAWSPSGDRIVYASDPDGNDDIWIMNSDGTGPVQVTSDPAPEYAPEWSPDGSQIVFMSEADVLPSVWVISVDGTSAQRLTWNDFYDGYPKWSPDGSRIAYMSVLGGTETWYILSINADGSNKRVLASGNDWTWHPSWSPDGRKLLFDSQRDGRRGVYIMNADGTGQTKLTHLTASPILDVARERGPGSFAAELTRARRYDAEARYYFLTELRALAREWIAAGRYPEADQLLDIALDEEPGSFDTFLVKSRLLRAQDRPTPPEARELVDTMLVRGYDATLRRFRRAESEFPGWVFLREWRFDRIGWRHIQAGLLGQGLDMLRLNAEFFPESAAARERLGDALSAAGRIEEARSAYEQAMRLAPSAAGLADKIARLSRDLE